MKKETDIFIDTEPISRILRKTGHGILNQWDCSSSPHFEEEEKQCLKPGTPLNILLIGGSGFIGRAIAEEALKKNYRVTVVSRGLRPIPQGATHLKADRKSPGELEAALCKTNGDFNLIVDCIMEHPNDAYQDIDLFSHLSGRLIVLSTDLVFAPEKRSFPQGLCSERFVRDNSPIGYKRQCEMVLFAANDTYRNWTILRPGHLYGPGHLPGCLPPWLAPEDFKNFLNGSTPPVLPCGGHFLFQPLFIDDFAKIILECPFTPHSNNQAIFCPGPDMIEMRQYVEVAAAKFSGKSSVQLEINEISTSDYLFSCPQAAPYLCHRIYTTETLTRNNLPVPQTTFSNGMDLLTF